MAPRAKAKLAAVLPQLSEVFRFLETFQKSTADVSEIAKITSDQVDGLLSMVAGRKIALPDATATLELLQGGHPGISEADIDRLSSAVRGGCGWLR